ncbi:MAG TPA: hypothetical protein ENN60_03670 [archaeon]|nr:hypothetical protein [archaeon]
MRFAKYDKARMLKETDRVECEGQLGSSLYFKVYSGDKVYQVSFRGPKKQWLCDCQYFVIKAKTCSHVLACKLWIKEHGLPPAKPTG